MLHFTFDNSESSIYAADFLIEYDNPKNWNDYGHYILYRLYALPRITGKGRVALGRILIVSSEDTPYEHNALSRIMSATPVFTSLTDSFYSRMTDEHGAQLIFRLLNPNERKEFCSALRLCLDLDMCKEISKNVTGALFRRVCDNPVKSIKTAHGHTTYVHQEDEMWEIFDKEDLLPVRKYLCSELTLDDIRIIESQNNED